MASQEPKDRPSGKGGVGEQKPESAEATGRSEPLIYTCFNDGAQNYVHGDWQWVQCWRCGQFVDFRK